MSEVKRYDVDGFGGGMIEIEGGAWYHMDDYEALAAECERLRAANDRLHAMVNRVVAEGILIADDRDAALAELATVKKVAYGNLELLDETELLKAELAALKGGQDELQAQKKLMEQALSDLWSVRIDKIKSHCMDAAPPAQASAWVAVSERLPAETFAYGCHTNDVLCRTRSGKLIIAMLAQTTTGPVWYDQQSQERDVTHWQPLPAAPTPGASDGKGGDHE